VFFAAFSIESLFAQEVIGSQRESYLELLALAGMAERPYLNYRSLSDSVWDEVADRGPWAGVSERATRMLGSAEIQLYGPEVFVSYNSAYPHGMNDGALWQGVGVNASASLGARVEVFGIEATLKPTVLAEQNGDFEIMASAYPSDYGYFWGCGIDLPQRLGKEGRIAFDWGDSELRYSLGPFTAGFGTEAVWLGPGKRNAIMLSNNAPSFPKADIGLRKTHTFLGDIEARSFWGKLEESEYFDADESNDANLLTGLALAWAPRFLPGLTLGLNRTMLSAWSAYDWEGLLTLIDPFMDNSAGTDSRDQRASLTADYLLPEAGIEVYLEWARNDFSPSLDMIMRYPFHSQAYSLGLRKLLRFGDDSRFLGELLVEATNLESSRDYEFLWPTTFYAHHIIRQGYTNEGQILGAGIGTGGNCQYLGFSLYHPLGRSRVYVQRVNRNNDYVYFLHMGDTVANKRADEYMFNTEFTAGADSYWLLTGGLRASLGAAYCLNLNPLYDPVGQHSTKIHNLYLAAGIRYQL
jgi:hypothetical protein